LYTLKNGPTAPAQTAPGAWWLSSFLNEITALILLVYVLSRRGLRLSDLGLRWSLKDVGVGLPVYGLSYGAYFIGYTVLQYLHFGVYGSWAHPPTFSGNLTHPLAVAILFSLLNPFFEELIVRAYLMSEVSELTGSLDLAVALSVIIQYSYHLYYGWMGAISMSFMFLVFALYYALSRRILPVIVAHALLDIIGVICYA